MLKMSQSFGDKTPNGSAINSSPVIDYTVGHILYCRSTIQMLLRVLNLLKIDLTWISNFKNLCVLNQFYISSQNIQINPSVYPKCVVHDLNWFTFANKNLVDHVLQCFIFQSFYIFSKFSYDVIYYMNDDHTYTKKLYVSTK